MDSEKLKEITAKANEAVENLPVDLRPIALQTILNKLLEEGAGKSKQRKKRATKRKNKRKPANNLELSEFEETTQKLRENIGRTKYPLMHDLKITLDMALYVLKIAKDEMKIDGLLPSQIAIVLWENFRLKATPNAVSMALMKAMKYVDRKPITIKGGAGYTYHIMHEGEKYLAEKIASLKNDRGGKNG